MGERPSAKAPVAIPAPDIQRRRVNLALVSIDVPLSQQAALHVTSSLAGRTTQRRVVALIVLVAAETVRLSGDRG
jgi:hypothetical protein